jgi:hypothetical protein
MNKAISLSKIIEEAAYLQDDSTKLLSGSISKRDFHDSRGALQSLHRGLFSFVAFHPGIDSSVAEYIEKGSIASDSGPNILVLFYSAKDIRFPRAIANKDLVVGVELDLNVHPAYEFAQWLLPGQSLPSFPGLMFMDRVVDSIDAVYIPLAKHSTAQEVADFCRSVFVLANQVLKERELNESLDALSVALKRNGFEYTKTSDTTVREWLITLYQFSKKHGATIASVISKVVKIV